MLPPHRIRQLQLNADSTFQLVDPATGTLIDRGLADVKVSALARIAAWRWTKSISGFVIPNTTTFIRTDMDTRATIDQTINLIDLGIKTEPFNYKGANGWIAMTRADLIQIAGAMAAFVQGCFDAEKTASEAVEAATTVEAIRTILDGIGV